MIKLQSCWKSRLQEHTNCNRMLFSLIPKDFSMFSHNGRVGHGWCWNATIYWSSVIDQNGSKHEEFAVIHRKLNADNLLEKLFVFMLLQLHYKMSNMKFAASQGDSVHHKPQKTFKNFWKKSEFPYTSAGNLITNWPQCGTLLSWANVKKFQQCAEPWDDTSGVQEQSYPKDCQTLH